MRTENCAVKTVTHQPIHLKRVVGLVNATTDLLKTQAKSCSTHIALCTPLVNATTNLLKTQANCCFTPSAPPPEPSNNTSHVYRLVVHSFSSQFQFTVSVYTFFSTNPSI